MNEHLIGVDIGTQGTKGALFDAAGCCLATAFVKSRLHQPSPGVVEEDPEYQVATVCRVIRECVRTARISPGSVAAIGIDGQMAGVIGIGANGRNVTTYDSWLDTRCAPQIEAMKRRAGREIVRRTGCAPSFNHGPKILWWMQERPAVFRRIRSFVQPGGYAVMRLCGLRADEAFIDVTYLHFSGFADNRRGRWDAGLCRAFGVDEAKLPHIVASQAIVGGLTAAMARACGLAPDTPVIAGCGDTAASFLAAGATRAGIGADVAGTASVFAATTAEFRADTDRMILGCGRSATPGLWHPYAYINGGGMNLEWFASKIAGPGAGKGSARFRMLERQAAAEPRADDPFFIPHLGGRVAPSCPALRGAWAGLMWTHSAGHLYRAMLEGVALEYAVYRKALRAIFAEQALRELRVVGGGGESALWNQIKSDVLGTPVTKLSRPEGAPMGAALLAGFGAGLFPDLHAAACQWIRRGATFRPNRRLASHYARRLADYERLLESVHKWSRPSRPEGK